MHHHHHYCHHSWLKPSYRVAFILLLTTGSLAVVLNLLPPASLCGSLRLRGSLLSPPTSLLSIEPLRDCCFEADALVPQIGSLQQRVLLTMRIGFSSARYFFFTCSAEMSVSLFTCCPPSESEGFRRGLGLGTTIAYQVSSPASLCRPEYIHSHCGQLRSFFLCCCVSCTVALLCAVVLLCLLHGCAGVHTSLNSVTTSFEASCEGLPCGIPSTECFVEPSLSLSHLKLVCRLLEVCNTGPGDCTASRLRRDCCITACRNLVFFFNEAHSIS